MNEITMQISKVCSSSLKKKRKTTRTDGPDGLVGNYDLFPIFLLENSFNSLQLSRTNGHGGAVLTLCELLTNAQDDVHAGVQGVLRLHANHLVRFAGETETNSAFAMTRQRPLNAGIDEHFSAVFASECTITLLEANILHDREI
jgi:hypothetical protein